MTTATQAALDQRMVTFRAEILSGHKEATAKALKRSRHERSLSFRRKGNEEQHRFNEKLSVELEVAQEQLEKVPALTAAKKAVLEGTKLLAERQKLIRLADRSEHGWGVVAEYEADELAADSGDEKRIEKAEKAAERKL
jgi:hypothetical protein